MEIILKSPCNPRTIVNRFIELASNDDKLLTPMQLIKLTYIAHGFSLAIFNKPLIDESVEAWRYGPVIPSLYRDLKKYGSSGVADKLPQAFFGAKTQGLDENNDKLIDIVYKKYGGLSGVKLSHLTHRKNTPWANMYVPDHYGIEINDSLIKAHYSDLLRKK